MTAEGIEVELKYRVADAAAATRLASVRALGSFRAAGRVRRVVIEDRYLDTPGGALRAAGHAVRLRQGLSGVIVSVKSAGEATGALHRRAEVEGPATTSLDPHDWPPSPARRIVLERAGDEPLVELVAVRQARRVRAVANETAEAELSLDEVEVMLGDRVIDRFTELEVELRRGPTESLGALAAVLAGDPDLAPERSSKLERALQAVERVRAGTPDQVAGTGSAASAGSPAARGDAPAAGGDGSAATDGEAAMPPRTPGDGAPPPATEAPRQVVEPPRLAAGKSPGVTPDDVLAEAGRKVLRFHFARMLAREAGTRRGTDDEDLHGMRVATRRMRAAWRVFGDGFRPSRTSRLRGRLRVVAGRLGAVRDLDVLIDAAAAHQSDLGARDAAAFEPLVAAWRAERTVARTVLLRELDSDAYLRLVEEYRVFVATEGAGATALVSPVAPHRVRDTAGSRIWLAYEQVRAYEAVLRWADIETVHQLRIAAKWLRYTLEFFREALGPETEPLITRVVALQDHLGWLHDADVTISLTRQFLVANAGALSRDQARVIAAYLVLRERELARLRRTMSGPWRAVSSVTFRRLLGRAVAAL